MHTKPVRVKREGYGTRDPVVIGPRAGSFHGKSTYTTDATVASRAAQAAAWPGSSSPGFAPDRMRRDEAMLELVRQVDAARKPLGAICHAGWVLISAGVVRGRNLTGFSLIRDDLVNAGGEYRLERVVVDRNLVTAQHAGDLPRFLAAFLRLVA